MPLPALAILASIGARAEIRGTAARLRVGSSGIAAWTAIAALRVSARTLRVRIAAGLTAATATSTLTLACLARRRVRIRRSFGAGLRLVGALVGRVVALVGAHGEPW